MKKVILVAVGLMCLLMAERVQAQCTFSDVPESHVFYDEITGICELGITTGYPDNTYRPSQSVTRGQMSAFIMRTIDNVVTKVFDANDQYLGNFIVITSDSIDVFIPSLKKQTRISALDGHIRYLYLYFESNDCTGQAYADHTSAMFHIWLNSGKYYTGVATIPTQITAQSYKSEGTCYSDNQLLDVLPINEITLPFTAPVALPMRLE